MLHIFKSPILTIPQCVWVSTDWNSPLAFGGECNDYPTYGGLGWQAPGFVHAYE